MKTNLSALLVAILFVCWSVVTSPPAQAQNTKPPAITKQTPTQLPMPGFLPAYNLKVSFEITNAGDGVANEGVECYAVVRINGKKLAGLKGVGTSRDNAATRKRGETLVLDDIAAYLPRTTQTIALEVSLYDKDAGSRDDLLGKWTVSLDPKDTAEKVLPGDKATLRISVARRPSAQQFKMKFSFQVLDASDGVNNDNVECWATVRFDGQPRGGLQRKDAKTMNPMETLDLTPVFFSSGGDVSVEVKLYDRDSGSQDDLLGSWTTTLSPLTMLGKEPIVLEGAKARLTITCEKNNLQIRTLIKPVGNRLESTKR